MVKCPLCRVEMEKVTRHIIEEIGEEIGVNEPVYKCPKCLGEFTNIQSWDVDVI